ncbi:DUF2282 domain-containing protein [Photobacterium sp. DNB23_23_1]|uniref:DUF2282 domain-containing protein n=1 Tax=Photobacterium pectinilyticum TaxID=2906793 RepID=A0ABT1MZI1_9GAMM|nr:DUF2282 domain-containing protein [Photobacterium sp. ZSDE20]MCQ1057898.1 DUF2282 domain-containing protein [Photobacterium sp. ZSDE20]MDD1822430.1 DUF2282 domain-containing protein [Photobacterium sp. ZSDE20]
MKKTTNIALATAVTGLIALAGTAMTTTAAVAAEEKEKCYGVVKAGKNDCATKTSSCAGTSKTDGQKDAFVMVPKGLCDRLAGGSTSSS